MKRYVRIQNGVAVEVIDDDGGLAGRFHPDLVWEDVSDRPEIAEGWRFDGSRFAAPPQPEPAAGPAIVAAPSAADLQAEFAALSRRLNELAARLPAAEETAGGPA